MKRTFQGGLLTLTELPLLCIASMVGYVACAYPKDRIVSTWHFAHTPGSWSPALLSRCGLESWYTVHLRYVVSWVALSGSAAHGFLRKISAAFTGAPSRTPLPAREPYCQTCRC